MFHFFINLKQKNQINQKKVEKTETKKKLPQRKKNNIFSFKKITYSNRLNIKLNRTNFIIL